MVWQPPTRIHQCPACHQNTSEEAPELRYGPHALFQLLRYTRDPAGRVVKSSAKAQLPDTGLLVLRTRDSEGSAAPYQLKAAILHAGSLNSGHYTVALDKGPAPGQPQLWKVDDAPTQPIRIPGGWASTSRSVYALLATRLELTADLPLSPHQEQLLRQHPAPNQRQRPGSRDAAAAPTPPPATPAIVNTVPSPVRLPSLRSHFPSAPLIVAARGRHAGGRGAGRRPQSPGRGERGHQRRRRQ